MKTHQLQCVQIVSQVDLKKADPVQKVDPKKTADLIENVIGKKNDNKKDQIALLLKQIQNKKE